MGLRSSALCRLSPGPHSCLCHPCPRGRSVVLTCGPLPHPKKFLSITEKRADQMRAMGIETVSSNSELRQVAMAKERQLSSGN